MNYIKNNSVFLFLFVSFLTIILTLSYFLIQGEENVLHNWQVTPSYTENKIVYFSGHFNEERNGIELSWNVELASGNLDKFEIYQDNSLLREGKNASSAVLSMNEYDFKTGNNKFDLVVYLSDGTTMEKSVYVYIDEVYSFNVSQRVIGTSIEYTLHYYYDDRNPVNVPQMYVYNISEPVTIEYVSSSKEVVEDHYIHETSVFQLDYSDVASARYEIFVEFEFVNFNLKYSTTSVIDVTGVQFDETEN